MICFESYLLTTKFLPSSPIPIAMLGFLYKNSIFSTKVEYDLPNYLPETNLTYLAHLFYKSKQFLVIFKYSNVLIKIIR